MIDHSDRPNLRLIHAAAPLFHAPILDHELVERRRAPLVTTDAWNLLAEDEEAADTAADSEADTYPPSRFVDEWSTRSIQASVRFGPGPIHGEITVQIAVHDTDSEAAHIRLSIIDPNAPLDEPREEPTRFSIPTSGLESLAALLTHLADNARTQGVAPWLGVVHET